MFTLPFKIRFIFTLIHKAAWVSPELFLEDEGFQSSTYPSITISPSSNHFLRAAPCSSCFCCAVFSFFSVCAKEVKQKKAQKRTAVSSLSFFVALFSIVFLLGCLWLCLKSSKGQLIN